MSSSYDGLWYVAYNTYKICCVFFCLVNLLTWWHDMELFWICCSRIIQPVIPPPASESPSWRDHKCLDWIALPVSVLSLFTLLSTSASLSYATFIISNITFNLQNSICPLLNFFSSLKHHCLRQLTITPFLFPPTFFKLIFIQATLLAFMSILLNLQSFLPTVE